jgi:hypothetical protein
VLFRSPITFFTIISDGGNNPKYQWFVNDVEKFGQTDTSFTYLYPQDGDIVICRLISDVSCATSDMVYSNPILIKIKENVTPAFSFGSTLAYCKNETPVILPTTSNNGIEGTWEPSSIATSIIGETVYAFAPNDGECVVDDGKITLRVTVTNCGYTIYGTVFPFVQTDDSEFNQLFETTVKLYSLPPVNIFDKIGYLRKQTPLHSEVVTLYDCNVDDVIVGAPKNPGIMGNTNNPGLQIRWEIKGITDPGIQDTTTINNANDCPEIPIGKYIITGVDSDEYVLEIERPGFLPRYGVISVTGDAYLGHRELLGGDVNDDLVINEKDIATFQTKISQYNNANYINKYDLDGDKIIDFSDLDIIRVNLNINSNIYKETEEFLNQ